jgi:ribosomal protein L29
MSFEKFKHAIRKMKTEELKKEILERKKELFKWNNPNERINETTGYDYSKKVFMLYSKHPFKKTRKELAILNQEISKRTK